MPASKQTESEASPAATLDKAVVDNRARQRYEIRINGELAGYSLYKWLPGTVVFTETVIAPRFRGQGTGSRLIAAALADAERRDLRIVPRCPFVQDFIRLQPDPRALRSAV
jgi:uncharacterized protein